MFEYAEASTIILCIFALVVGVERTSSFLFSGFRLCELTERDQDQGGAYHWHLVAERRWARDLDVLRAIIAGNPPSALWGRQGISCSQWRSRAPQGFHDRVIPLPHCHDTNASSGAGSVWARRCIARRQRAPSSGRPSA
jgi:hypothetical protein